LAGVPLVVLDRTPRGYGGPSVTLDNRAAGRMVAEHLLSLGHRHLAHIAGPKTVSISEERLAGFQEVLRANGAAVPIVERACGWRMEAGYGAAQRLIRRGGKFTAIFAAGDQLAIGATRALREAGLTVPAGVSLIGIDDIDMAAYLTPPLTTISQSVPRMAAVGIELLLAQISGQSPAQPQVVIQPELVIRQSTAPC